MNNSGEAADQVIRMYLNGIEVAAKLTGTASKQIAVLLYAVLRDQKRTKGKERLTSMLRSGKELKVFAVKDGDLQTFCKAAKEYGVLYCVLKNKNAKDGITDIMVRAEDASKINRIYERFHLATVDRASLKSEIIRSKQLPEAKDAPGKHEHKRSPEDELIDKLLGVPQREERENPTAGVSLSPPSKESLSEPTSEAAKQASVSEFGQRPSVRQEIRRIKARRKLAQQVPAPGTERNELPLPKIKAVKGKER